MLNDLGFGNRLALGEGAILKNLRGVQARNGIERSGELDGMDFTTEMETGTGKTYVYLRTVHELHACYGFNKFVVAVPSVAIHGGVKMSIEIAIGTYNPDWAVVKQSGAEEKLYLVRETKSDLDPDKRRKEENVKIRCGEAHFDALSDIGFKVVNDAQQV